MTDDGMVELLMDDARDRMQGAIDALDAIEWTPQAGIENGGDPRWFDMDKKILDAGKSLQVVDLSPDQVVPVLDAIGGKGVYFLTGFSSAKQAEELMDAVEQYR